MKDVRFRKENFGVGFDDSFVCNGKLKGNSQWNACVWKIIIHVS